MNAHEFVLGHVITNMQQPHINSKDDDTTFLHYKKA